LLYNQPTNSTSDQLLEEVVARTVKIPFSPYRRKKKSQILRRRNVKRSLFFVLSVLVVGSMALAACAPAATPTTAPTTAPTQAPTSPPATQAPTTPATAAPTACAATGTAPIPFPDGGKSITLGFSQEADNAITYMSAMTYSAYLGQMTEIGLGKWDDQNNFVPDLAQDVPTAENGGVSADGLTITWKLKPCLFWSDGTPLTSADVAFTWQALTDPGTACTACGGFDKIASIDTPDDQTVVIKFKELYPPWQTLFSTWGNGGYPILPKHLLDGHKALESDPYLHWPTIASGAWVIADWVPGDHIQLLPNPNYHGGRPKLDQILVKFTPDPETTKAGMKNGDIDMTPDFTESDIPSLQAMEPGVHITVKPGNFFDHYFFNMGITDSTVKDASGNVIGNSDVAGFCPFKDVNVRKAFALGINRQAIVDNLLYGKTTVPGDLWINSFWDAKLDPYPYDPTTAAQLLDTAGYKLDPGGKVRHGMCDGKDTKLSIDFQTTTKQIRQDMAVAAQSDLAKIGIEFKPTFDTSTVFFGNYTEGGPLATGKYDMGDYATGFFPDPYPATQDFLCEAVPNSAAPGGQNFYHICDQKLEDLFAQTLKSADPAVRKPIFDQIQQYQYDNYFFIPIYAWANISAYTDRLVEGPWGAYSTWFWNTETWDVK
jgi:peptide/nickel transport system substrate-binding protein